MFNELNSGKRTIKEGIELKDLQFVKLKEMVGTEIKVDGYFFTEGDYGKQVVVVGNGKKINMPLRAVKLFESIDNNPDLVKGVLEGKCKIVNIKEGETKKGKTILFELADC